MRNSFRRKNGFTFVEVTLVAALVFILSSLSVAFYSRFLTQNAVSNTVDILISDLRKAQTYAMTGKQNSNWGVGYSGGKIILYQGTSIGARVSGFDESYMPNANISISGFSDLNFTRVTGTSSAALTITISGQNNTKTVTVNSLGVVSR